jgi:hypothetical protein
VTTSQAMIESASSTAGTAKLRTSREQEPAPRSSTGTSSAPTCRNFAAAPPPTTLPAQSATRDPEPVPVSVRAEPAGA